MARRRETGDLCLVSLHKLTHHAQCTNLRIRNARTESADLSRRNFQRVPNPVEICRETRNLDKLYQIIVVLLQSTKSFSESLQGRQLVESGKIVGLKSKPSDSVTSDLCTNYTDSSESTCVVIEGKLKFFYKNSTMSEDELKESEAIIQSVIKKGMEDGTLKRANAAIVELVYIPKIDADAVVGQ